MDFAIRERNKLSDKIIARLEAALKNCYISLGNEKILSKNNDIYYRTINILSLKSYSIIQKNFFRNPINSLRKVYKVFKIKYLLR